MKKVLVTGGSGYFGSLLIEKLKEKGFDCAIFDINDTEDRTNDVTFFQGDIRDYESISEATKGMDIVFHNVAQVPLAKDRELFESVNGLGTENVLRASLESGVQKLVYTSSSAIFGVPKENPVTEYTQPTPGEEYGQAKYEGELKCHEYVKKGLDVSIIRPRTIMGHGRLGIFQILFEWVREGRNIPVFDGGNNVYQFIHADDLAEVCILSGMKKGPAIYNCGTDRFGTMREVLEALVVHANTGSKVRSVPMGPVVLGMKVTSAIGLSPLGAYHALMYGKSMYFDTTKVETEFSWQAKYSNIEMFIDSYNWYVENREKVLTPDGNASHHRSAVKQGVLNVVKRFL
ncbi:NAD-dependent epimerase/dehydratase family protein [Vibrio algarum]|uniref:NAD-dependent epimerase/dehydratase family protein n=1 Tax=Vibrio algarum TaxID=3020714 RepID=A0ABT4YLM2_9VIBR|nr:NAD-dependent epimerase/dehydratase family protein [Vibrio sp. KJ40-1]MDB1122423.1 NAD-dependent epimerase/dehydratase family protein [Vibrio sp. KJ40-1]